MSFGLRFVLGLGILVSGVSEASLTRAELLKGSPVPERREFPRNEAVSPCENFHLYVCGAVESSFKIPAHRSYWSFSFTDNAERLLHAKKQYFYQLERGAEPRSARAKPIKNYYLACMNEKAARSEERGIVETEAKRILAIRSLDELAELLQSRIDAPEASFLGFTSVPNQSNPIRNDLILLANAMTLPERSYYSKPEVLADLEKFAQAVFRAVGASRPQERARKLIEFERAFAEAYPLPSQMRERFGSDTYLEREAWAAKYPRLRLTRFIERLPPDVKLRDYTPESMVFLNEQMATGDLEALKSVLLFRSIHSLMDDAYPNVFRIGFEFERKHLGGPEKRADRQERCTQAAMNQYAMELDEELTSILFPEFPRERVVKVAEGVRSSLLRALDSNDWLSPSARKEAKAKIAKARLFLVSPQTETEWNFNPRVELDPKAPLANSKKLRKANIEKQLVELAADRSRERWLMGPLTLNAYYTPTDNQFVLLQGILQFPFFAPDQSDIENMGAIGAIVGHELGHAIDDSGSKFDSDGRVRQWLTDKDLVEFRKRGEVFKKQFDEIGHDGTLTLGENIGDHVGLSSSYAAAFPNPKKASSEDKLKFFEAYARVWCGVARPDFEKVLLKTDSHALGRERINQQVVHMTGFYEAYGCKASDRMYRAPEKRVRVW